METSEGDDIPQGMAKCYMNHTRLHSETSLLGLSGIPYQRRIYFTLGFLFFSLSVPLEVLFH